MGLLQLVRDVRQLFIDEGVTANVVLGDREAAKQLVSVHGSDRTIRGAVNHG